MEPSDNIDDSVEYDSESGVYRVSYEEPVDGPSIALVEVIAAIDESDPSTLEPLGHTIDTDALDRVLHHSNSTQRVEVTFLYKGYRVTIRSEGVIEVLPTDPDQTDQRDNSVS